MNCLLSLPEVLQIYVFTSWLYWRDIGRLDSAICNRVGRLEFRKLVQSEECVIPKLLSWSYKATPPLAWILRKGMRLEYFELTKSVMDNVPTKVKVLRQIGPTLTSLRLQLAENSSYYKRDPLKPPPAVTDFDLAKLLTEIVEHCTKLDHCFIMGSIHANEDRHIPLNNVTHLPAQMTKLELMHMMLTNEWLEVLASAPNLIELWVCYNDSSLVDFENLVIPAKQALRSLTCTDPRICAVWPNISSLKLNHFNTAHIDLVVQCCPRVKSVYLFLDDEMGLTLDDTRAECIAKHWLCLEHLAVSSATDAAVLLLVQHRHTLLTLSANKHVLIDCKHLPGTNAAYPTDYRGSRLRAISLNCNHSTLLQTVIMHCPYLYALHLCQPKRPRKGNGYGAEIAPEDAVENALHCITGTCIQSLQLRDYTELTNNDLQPIQHMNLVSLYIRNSRKLMGGNLLRLLSGQKRLHTLLFEYCPALPSSLVLSIAALCPTLRDFTFITVNDVSNHANARSLFQEMMKRLHPKTTKCHICC